ncbi:MAG: hypothetical protein R3292_11735 [Alcanivorax sp.]|nr:hypothetical protein [Alcanivorax sp.]
MEQALTVPNEPPLAHREPQIATVQDSHPQQLTLRLDESDAIIEPIAVARHEQPLCRGDKVLVQPCRQGWVVTSLLGGQANCCFSRSADGEFRIRCDQGLRLQAGDACIVIDAQGRITVDGREIHALASGLQRIMGSLVQIN